MGGKAPLWIGIPAGGTTGQVLIKGSNLDRDVTWSTPATPTPGGSDGQIQFNSSGAFAGDANLTWDSATTTLGMQLASGSGTPPAGIQVLASNSTQAFAVEDIGGGVIVSAGDVQGSVGGAAIRIGNDASTPSSSYAQLLGPYVSLGDPGLFNGSVWTLDDSAQKTTSNVKHEASGNITVMTNGQGLHQQSPNGHYWRLDVSNAGVASWTDIGTSPP